MSDLAPGEAVLPGDEVRLRPAGAWRDGPPMAMPRPELTGPDRRGAREARRP